MWCTRLGSSWTFPHSIVCGLGKKKKRISSKCIAFILCTHAVIIKTAPLLSRSCHECSHTQKAMVYNQTLLECLHLYRDSFRAPYVQYLPFVSGSLTQFKWDAGPKLGHPGSLPWELFRALLFRVRMTWTAISFANHVVELGCHLRLDEEHQGGPSLL